MTQGGLIVVCLDWRRQITVPVVESVFKDEFTGQQTLGPVWEETTTRRLASGGVSVDWSWSQGHFLRVSLISDSEAFFLSRTRRTRFLIKTSQDCAKHCNDMIIIEKNQV